MITKPAQPILIVEDSPEDYQATVRSLTKTGLSNPILHCEDGDRALDYLFRRGPFAPPAPAPRPGVILLDVNLPGTDGLTVLTEIKNAPELAAIPVIVLSISADERDIEACFRAGANGYLKKPVDLEGYLTALQRLGGHCFEIVVLPKPADAGDDVTTAGC